jgi:hypothetical protein
VIVEFRANAVTPPTAAGNRRHHAHTVLLKLGGELGLLDQSIHMHAVQINNDKSILTGRGRLEDIAQFPGDFNARPADRFARNR